MSSEKKKIPTSVQVILGFTAGIVLSNITPESWPFWYELAIVLGIGLAIVTINNVASRGEKSRSSQE